MSMNLLDIVKSYMDSYPRMINDYFSGKKTEKELTDVTTQPFWYSMTLSKRRMAKKGITSEVNLTLDTKQKRSIAIKSQPEVYSMDYMTWGAKQGYQEKDDGVHESGMLVRKVISHRTYKKDGLILYKKKDHEYCQLSILKSMVKNGKVVCPNCGYEDEVAHFSDGCDSCGSSFTVNDFEPKVSGFSVDENVQDKIVKTLNRSYLTMILISYLCIGISFFLYKLIFSSGKGIDFLFIHLNPGQLSIVFLILVIIGILSHVNYLLVLIPLGILRTKYVKRYGTMYDNVDIVNNFYKEFSPADFSQKLECKVKNIMLADNTDEVKPFSTLDLSSRIHNYSDVIDCNLVSFRFENATKMKKHYVISGDAKFRLFEYKKNKIVSRHEMLHITMQGKEGVVDQPINQLKEYKCPNCSNSVNLLKGSTCEYCGSEFSYDDFDWMITRMDTGEKPKNVLARVRIWVPVIFILFYLPFLYLTILIGTSTGMEAHVIFNNDELVYVDEEYYADKDTYTDFDDLFYNHILDGVYLGDEQFVGSTKSNNDFDLVFQVDQPEETIKALQAKWSDMGYSILCREDGYIYYVKEDVYLNYSQYNATIRLRETPDEYECLTVGLTVE